MADVHVKQIRSTNGVTSRPRREPGDQRRRNEDAHQHERDGDQRAGDFVHGAVRRIARGKPFLAHHALGGTHRRLAVT